MIASRSSIRRFAGVGASAALALSLFTGCASTQALDAEAAEQLQAGVLTVTEAAAANDLVGAQARLVELEAALAAALEAGQVSTERHDSIVAAIEAVRAEITALLEAQTPEPVPAPVTPDVEAPPATDPGDQDEQDEEKNKQQEQDQKKLEEEQKRLEEQQKKEEEENKGDEKNKGESKVPTIPPVTITPG